MGHPAILKIFFYNFIGDIKSSALVVNAQNDPFLPDSCYPFKNFEKLKRVYLEVPQNGGHCGFSIPADKDGFHWSERRALEFLSKGIDN